MFELDAKLTVYLHRDAIDFRKSINGLAALIEAGGMDPFGPALYAFSNRRRDRIKLLGWGGNGFWLLMKRLEEDRFVWPRRPQAVMELTTEQLHWLFSDTVAGAKASAIVYSLMLTCRACGVEPYAYLLHVLTELPQRNAQADIRDLLPFNFAKSHSASVAA